MENLNAEREQITGSNNELYNYVKRIVAAVNYKGNCDHEDVPSILRKFAEGYEQRIKELTEENERLRAIPERICEEARQMCFIVGDEEYVTLCELDQIAKEMLEGREK